MNRSVSVLRAYKYRSAFPYRSQPTLPKQIRRDAVAALRWIRDNESTFKSLLVEAKRTETWDEELWYAGRALDRVEQMIRKIATDFLDPEQRFTRVDFWSIYNRHLTDWFDQLYWPAAQRGIEDFVREAYETRDARFAPLTDFLLRLVSRLKRVEAYLDAVDQEAEYEAQGDRDKKDPRSDQTGSDPWPRGIEDVEVLWHVTTNWPGIEEHGFLSRAEMEDLGLEWGGIGGSVTGPSGPTISFTGSREWADDILDFFHDAQVLLQESTVGALRDYAISFGLSAASDPSSVETLDFVNVIMDGIGEIPWDAPDDTPLDSKLVYWAWKKIHYASCSIGQRFCIATMNDRGNKLFELLRSGDPDQFRIVKAWVDMNHPGIIYNRREEEFRVPPDALRDYEPDHYDSDE